jgi:hypothetical protein
MKKIRFILLATLMISALPFVSQAQFYVGLSGGGLSTIITNQNNYGLSEMDYKVTFGGAGNVVFGYDFGKHIGLSLQVGYAKLGQEYKDNINDTSYARNVKLNYLQVPLLFKYRSGGDVVRFYAMAGPQFDYLLSASQTYYKNEVPTDDQVYNPNIGDWVKIGEETITDRFNSIDIFLRGDAGVEFTFLKSFIASAGITLGYGLMDINASDWQLNDSSGNYHASHNIYGGMLFGLAYKF